MIYYGAVRDQRFLVTKTEGIQGTNAMIELNPSNHQIVVKGYSMFLWLGMGAMFMAGSGIRTIFEMFPLEDGWTFPNILGLVFMCIWTSIALGMCIYALRVYGRKIIIDDVGVSWHTWFTKEQLKWNAKKYFGLSYCGQTRGEGNTYILYFSKKQHPIRNECKKKLKGKMIKTYVMESDYEEVLQIVIPFCISRTKVEPFIGKDQYHFL